MPHANNRRWCTSKLAVFGVLLLGSLPLSAQRVGDLAEAVLDQGNPAIRFCGSYMSEHWYKGKTLSCYVVAYLDHGGQPAFQFYGAGYMASTKSDWDFAQQDASFGLLYITRERVSFESKSSTYAFDTSRRALSQTSADTEPGAFVSVGQQHNFWLFFGGPFSRPAAEGALATKDSPDTAVAEAQARRFLALAISDFGAAEQDFERLTASLGVPYPRAVPATVAAPERPATADLKIVSRPGSVQSYVDDRFKGVTSEGEGVLVVENLAPGSHRIRLGLPGYKEWRQEVTLTAGDTLEVVAKLVSAGPAPLTLDEVDEALTNGVPKKRVIALVTQFGVDFALTEEVEQRLRKSGADSDLLLLITKSRK